MISRKLIDKMSLPELQGHIKNHKQELEMNEKMNKVTWIKGQNASGKTLYIKKLLGATFEQWGTLPLDIIQNPPDIEKDFPAKLTPSDFIFYYGNITLPKHIILRFKASQVLVFIEKKKGHLKETDGTYTNLSLKYNKIFRMYEKYLQQNDVVQEKEANITELKNYIQKIKERNADRTKTYKNEIQSLHNKIAERKKIEVGLEEVHEKEEMINKTPGYHKYWELLDIWNKTRTDADWTALREYESSYKELEEQSKNLDLLRDQRHELEERGWKLGWAHNLESDLNMLERNPPELDYTWREEHDLNWAVGVLNRYKRKLVKQSDIQTLIESYPSKKTVWVDGKPSSDFSDFYDIIMTIQKLSPEKVFISHCGDETWFNALPYTFYTLSSGKKTTLDLAHIFDCIFIEVPTLDERVVIAGENS